ncbi:hypothetical protein FYZ48_25945 [Gimesia chilikensis]|uniref:hypothetical protein n=1 Tax=Gimesia chilikensis TaxID=2605989 RepID=UPI0011EE9CEF|nr:hypothetical protein [Gimesia chilikensis]KAA0131583.1 hypothetical protein FYZ48_25945 [Gimesia chilikensis]
MVAEQKPLFSLGQVVATPDAIAALEEANESAMPLLQRHQCGDWGCLCEDDQQMNDVAVGDGARILSSYVLDATGQKVWIITEADRSSTTILLPENY